ncbi:sulfatase-like hydrolase/transferase [Delftia sp. Lp-1]|uniref:sulfatase-like hydrolase/transferase n=1 Tax=Delftia sp. Lp-1 TaxID=682863 RepID=UPI001E2F78CD|nr:sulfatase-like hydrolase/transferase [Delftia sp. Lp-1]MCB4788973.1 sulfatase-like hydrolase/transferase [Delftia sp. Lp-1]
MPLRFLISLTAKERNKNIAKPAWKSQALFFLILSISSIAFQCASIYFGYKRYLFNLETILSFLIFSMGYRWFATIIFIASVFQEIFLGMASILYLFDYSQIKTIAGFIFEAKTSYIFSLGIALLIISTIFIGTSHLLRKVSWQRVLFILVTLTAVQLTASFKEGNFNKPSLASRENLIFGSSSYFIQELFELNRKLFNLRSHDNVDYVQIQSPSAFELTVDNSLKKENQPDKILFIIAESWGLPTDPKILEQQIQSLRDNKKLEIIKLTNIHAVGATAFAEFRELCGKIPTKLNLNKIAESDLGPCRPKKFSEQGYKTISIHGAHGTMYDRVNWYPVLGFQEMIFKEILPFGKEYQCYSFPGYCDRYLFPTVVEKISSTEKVFLYWMTLNSHTPYDRRDTHNYRENLCKAVFKIDYEAQLCTYQNLHTQFFDNLSEALQNPSLTGTEVVIVGDHAPIFNNESSRSLFETQKVPVLHLLVK